MCRYKTSHWLHYETDAIVCCGCYQNVYIVGQCYACCDVASSVLVAVEGISRIRQMYYVCILCMNIHLSASPAMIDFLCMNKAGVSSCGRFAFDELTARLWNIQRPSPLIVPLRDHSIRLFFFFFVSCACCGRAFTSIRELAQNSFGWRMTQEWFATISEKSSLTTANKTAALQHSG